MEDAIARRLSIAKKKKKKLVEFAATRRFEILQPDLICCCTIPTDFLCVWMVVGWGEIFESVSHRHDAPSNIMIFYSYKNVNFQTNKTNI